MIWAWADHQKTMRRAKEKGYLQGRISALDLKIAAEEAVTPEERDRTLIETLKFQRDDLETRLRRGDY